MSHVHSDPEMMLAAQIAYLDFTGKDRNVGEKVDNILSNYGVQDAKGNWTLKPEYEGNKKVEQQFGSAKSIQKIAKSSGAGEDWRNWNVVDVCNDQNDSGYYGLMIDTGDGNAIIGSRGSESTDLSTGYKDWGEADLGLLDSEATKQQERAEKYMEKLYYKYGDKYDKFSVGGHSLGGNLAMHMVITAPEGMIEKIDRCTSMDGPGFSEEYIKAHQKEIDRRSNLLDHYRWSVVSNLLNPIPGSDITYVKSEGSIFGRHSLKNVQYDENGEFESDNQEALEAAVNAISKDIDSMGIEAVIKAANMERLAALYYNAAVIAKTLSMVIRGFEKVTQTLKEWANNVYYNYIAPKVSGTYEVNNKSLSIMAGEIQALEKELSRLNDDVERIRKNLKFWSISGGYYRSKILSTHVGLESDLKKLKKMAEVAENAAKQYNSVDMQVKGKFA